MELVESNFELLTCGEPCTLHHSLPPLWTGKSINPKCILHTLVRIMKDPMSEDQIKRQMCLLQDLKHGLTRGFWVQDIEDSTKLIEILMCKGEILPVFFEYAKYLLCLMKYPPLMCRTNEILDFERDVQGYFDFFGYMLVTTPKLVVREIILTTLKELLQHKKPLPNYSMPWAMMTRQIEMSNLPLILTQYMELCTNDVYFDLIQIISSFASFSSSMCMALIKYGCLQIVMMRLDPEWQDHLGGPRPQYETIRTDPNYPLDDSIMLIHTLLNAYRNYPDDEIKEEIISPTIEALWGLRYALRLYTIEGRYKNERNFIAALWLLFAECFPDGKHVHSGIVHDFASLSTIGNATLGGKWAAAVHFSVMDYDDFEFKRMMMMGLILFVNCLGSSRIYQDEKVMPAMCKLLDVETSRWSPEFHEKMLFAVLNVFQHILPDHIDEFKTCDGPKRIDNILQQLVIDGDYDQQFELYCQTMRFNFKMVRTFVENKCLSQESIIVQSKLQRDIIKQMFDIDFKLRTQKIMSMSLNILGIMPDNDCAADVEFLIALLNRVLNPRPTEIAYIQRLVISAVSLTWKHGLHNNVNFLYFIKLKGIYLLLDLMKDAEFPVQMICLGFLVDVIQEGTAIPYFVTWQKDAVGILALLMNIFRKECEQLGVGMLPRGVIADPKFPLMGRTQKEAFSNQDYPSEVSPSLTDLFFSCRPKIYAILQLLNHRHGETLELVNDYYKTFDSNLSIDNKITKILCDNYLVIKIGEMWMELNVYVNPIEPTPIHRYMLDTLLDHFLKCGSNIQTLQNNWLAIESKNAHISEEEFYNLLRETKLGPAILGLKEMKSLACASNARFRKPHCQVIEQPSEKAIIETHRTMLTANKFVAGQKLVIQSDIILDPFAPDPPKPISDDGGDDHLSMYDGNLSEISLSVDINCKEFRSDGLHEKCCRGGKKKIKKKNKSKSPSKKNKKH